jgi:hypothetical protein
MKNIQINKKLVRLVVIGFLLAVIIMSLISMLSGDSGMVNCPGDDVRISEHILKLTGGGAHYYHRKSGAFPTNENSFLNQLEKAGLFVQADEHIPPFRDYWGTKLKYTTSNNIAFFTSAGPDRVFGTEDDMVHTEYWRGVDSPTTFYEDLAGRLKRSRAGSDFK